MSQPFITFAPAAFLAAIMVNAVGVFVLVVGLGLLCFLLARKQRAFAFVLFVVLGVLMAGLTTPIFSPSKEVRSRIDCTSGRVQFEMAIKHWAEQKKITQGSDIDVQAVAAYFKGGSLPKCPEGGTFLMGKIGQQLTCTIQEHNKN